MILKYILDDYGNFAIFSEANIHSDMAEGFYTKPISAGFIQFREIVGESNKKISVHCYGKSISLNLKSHPEDSGIITKKLNGE